MQDLYALVQQMFSCGIELPCPKSLENRAGLKVGCPSAAKPQEGDYTALLAWMKRESEDKP